MMMSTEQDPHLSDAALEALFADVRDAAEPPVPDALMARVLADAQRLQPVMTAPVRHRTRGGWWRALFGAPGSPGTAAGLVAAGLAGVWIGFVQPLDLSSGLLGAASAETLDLYPADLDTLTEVLDLEIPSEG